jgi:hypothetical protein
VVGVTIQILVQTQRVHLGEGGGALGDMEAERIGGERHGVTMREGGEGGKGGGEKMGRGGAKIVAFFISRTDVWLYFLNGNSIDRISQI